MLEIKRKFFAFSTRGISGADGQYHGSKKRMTVVFIILAILLIGAIALYLYSRTFAKMNPLIAAGIPIADGSLRLVMERTLPHLYGMLGAAVVLAVVSLSFQTITQSRVLTPSMIGFDAVFVGTQTLIVFFLGAGHFLFANPFVNYVLTASIMVVVSMLMFGAILRSQKNNIVFLLMFGLVLSSIVRSSSTYLQLLMTEGDFFQVAAATSVNVNNMNVTIIWLVLPIIAAVIIATLTRHRRYNVMSLGSEQAKGLGIPYEREM